MTAGSHNYVTDTVVPSLQRYGTGTVAVLCLLSHTMQLLRR